MTKREKHQRQIMQCRPERIPERGPATLENMNPLLFERVIPSLAPITGVSP